MANQSLTAEQLREVLNYDPETGVFTRKVPARGVKAGEIAGCDNGRGYIRIRVCGSYVLAHRLAWLYVHGEWPAGEIDHVNRNSMDNRVSNLRVVDRTANLINRRDDRRNKSGIRNVLWDAKRQKWVAQLRRRGSQLNLGRFDSITDAAAAVEAARCKHDNFQPT